MFPSQNLNIDIEALSGICGSISIACWVVVFSPQIIENFRRGSADGLSLLFLVVWLAGDVFNILGAVLQGVLPTMVILAVYYTLADIVLLGQCFYYRGFTLTGDDASASSSSSNLMNGAQQDEQGDNDHYDTETPSPVISRKPTESTSLLSSNQTDQSYQATARTPSPPPPSHTLPPLPSQQQQHHRHHAHRRHSTSSFLHPSVDGTHLSPVTPFVEPPSTTTIPTKKRSTSPSTRSISTLQQTLFNLSAVGLVCAAGILGWYVTPHHHSEPDDNSSRRGTSNDLTFDPLGQFFGYLCALFYLGSRLPQILLNYKRKSTDGVSLLFFLFACIGNLTYVLSILAYSPMCKHGGRCRDGELTKLYGRYILVNLSWLIGSFGTLGLDMCIFVQFFLYKGKSGNGHDVVC